MKFEEAYKELNDEQKSAVDQIDGPVLVVAGPGSGKTQVLALRVANILKKTDTPPENILCLTFTDAAALNMRERLIGLIGERAHKVGIHTFHGFGVEIMARFPEFFYGGASFQSADEVTRTELLRDMLSNLSHDNPLSSLQPEKGYAYLEPIKRTIGYLKKGGITPDGLAKIVESNKKSLEFINPAIQEVFLSRMSTDSIKEARGLVSKLTTYAEENSSETYVSLVADSLGHAVAEAEEEGKTAPLTKWKTKWVKKNDEGVLVFKDARYIEKFEALVHVYKTYQDEMYKRGYYDFDDMLLNVIGKVKESETLRYEIQEHYQYVLVDEFQDTNEAQMAILRLIGSADVHEGRPNIMAVGDDDQAIYKFQGAELSNILDFKSTWRDPAIIVLTKNYRSHQDVLDLARYIILKGEERLEEMIPEVNKELSAGRPANKEAEKETSSLVFDTSAHEYSYIAREAARLIKEGTSPDEIAVIARKHKNIAEMLPYFAKEGVAIRYDQKRDVFLDPHIHQLIEMAHFVTSLADISTPAYEIDSHLPEILSYPFWNISRDVVWDISLRANSKEMRTQKVRSRFLAVMEKHDDPQNFSETSPTLQHMTRGRLCLGDLLVPQIFWRLTRKMKTTRKHPQIVKPTS